MTASRAQLAAAFAHRFETLAATAITRRGSFTVAVPGGSVAEAFFPSLRTISVDWAAVQLFWVDERAVPKTDPASNIGLACRLWLEAIPIIPVALHPMLPHDGNLDLVAVRCEEALVKVAGDPPVLDLVLLGVGHDGHIASLFPGDPALAERHRRVVVVDNAPKPPPRRLTLTLPVLAAARTIIVAAFGAEKAAAIADARDDPASSSPLAALRRAAPHAELWMDHAARV
jgi:6-phosphogluconolactonase